MIECDALLQQRGGSDSNVGRYLLRCLRLGREAQHR